MRTAASRMGVGLLLAASVAVAGEPTVTVDRFGTIPVLEGAPPPAPVVLFVSGDAGISPNVSGMAGEVAKLGTLVAVVDIWRYLHALDRTPGECSNPARDFDALARAVERQAGYPAYRVPVLVGFSSGATLVYAVLVQAAPGTFAGAISLGFCPDLPVRKPFCAGSGLESGPAPGGKGFAFLPAAHPSAPWVAFQGAHDDDCRPEAARAFVAQVGGASLVEITETDHYFHERKSWVPLIARVLDRMVAAPPPR